MPALAITDLSNAFRAHRSTAARGKGVKPIAGCDVWITHESRARRAIRAILLAAIAAATKLCDWLSRAFRTNQHRGAPSCAANG